MTDVLIRRSCEATERHTGRMPRGDGGREGSDASASQRGPRVTGNHQKPGESHEQMLPQLFQKEPILPRLLFQTSSPGNSENINYWF